jgi:hypothetical protein
MAHLDVLGTVEERALRPSRRTLFQQNPSSAAPATVLRVKGPLAYANSDFGDPRKQAPFLNSGTPCLSIFSAY